MEDEDNENGPVDSWSLWEEAYNKKMASELLLTQINHSDTYLDETENRENCFCSPYSHGSDGNESSDIDLKNVIEGLKNLNQIQDNHSNVREENSFEAQNNKINNVYDQTKNEEKEEMAEYTHYLGLQPALLKSNCSACNSVEEKTLEHNFDHCTCFSKQLSKQVQINDPISLNEHPTNVQDSIISCINNTHSVIESTTVDKNVKQQSIIKLESPSNVCELVINNSDAASSNSDLLIDESGLSPSKNSEISFAEKSSSYPINDFESNNQSNQCYNIDPKVIHTGSKEDISKSLTLGSAINKLTTISDKNVQTIDSDLLVSERESQIIHNLELLHDKNLQASSISITHEKQTQSVSTALSASISSEVQQCSIVAEPTAQSNNFKITRRVYLCAACETYFENWNLFLHMREVHSRYICLFCLGMFGQAERLSYHLTKKHSVPELSFQSLEEFYSEFKNSCYIICCLCEQIFSETNEFYNHFCPTKEQSKVCNTEISHPQIRSETNEQQSTHLSKILVPTQKTTVGERRQSKRTIKPNRLNDDVYLYTKLTNIRGKKMKSISEVTVKNESSVTSHKYTASKFEITKSIDQVNKETINICPSNNYSFQNIHDNVTETILEVSQYKEYSKDIVSQGSMLIDSNNKSIDKKILESSNPKDEDDVRLDEIIYRTDETKEFSIKNNLLGDVLTEFNSDSNTSESSQEDTSFNIKSETDIFNAVDKSEKVVCESVQKPISITDRSLVIKICTKNNSVFSVQPPTELENEQNHNNSRDSEENHNSELSDNRTSNDEKEEHYLNELSSDLSNDKIDIAHEEDNSNDSFKDNFTPSINLNKEVETELSENKSIQNQEVTADESEKNDGILLAGREISIVDLSVDNILENMEIEDLLKRCIRAVCDICVYCNHARHIAVNGKQLSLHMLSEHRFQPQHPAIVITPEQFITKVKKCLQDLELYYFNVDSYNSDEGTYNISTVKVYECFHCRFFSSSHKELYLHNRKMHQKPILICIMCKSTFYSYSELLCHLCPGVYAANANILYRCCLCSLNNFPSAFRLMVHLRKQHHACDVCLEITENQQRLSNHVWKHKLHHFCYRCNIAYRNKPDITKHLFWKHGTESVLCKKCLQKKWPHVYHFCIPPTTVTCEECGLNFSRVIALKVHKRIHNKDYLYSCSECSEKFISKKLLSKHEKIHKEPQPLPQYTMQNIICSQTSTEDEVQIDVCNTELKEQKEQEQILEMVQKEIIKKGVDVFDLPPLNLSSESDSDSNVEDKQEDEIKDNGKYNKQELRSFCDATNTNSQTNLGPKTNAIVEVERNEEEKKQEEQIMDDIWDNFKSYTESLEKQDSILKTNMTDCNDNKEQENIEKEVCNNLNDIRNAIFADHDYCIVYSDKNKLYQSETFAKNDQNMKIGESSGEATERTSPLREVKNQRADGSIKKKLKTPKKKKQNSASSSDSSSDSDSSNCSCGPDCSCSSSSSGSSSSSSSSDSDSSSSAESPPKTNRGKNKKEIELSKEEEAVKVIKDNRAIISLKEDNTCSVPATAEIVRPMTPPPIQIMESDLDTTESETDDENFYDENPLQLASKLLAEKRNKLSTIASTVGRIVSSPLKNGIIGDSDGAVRSTSSLTAEQSELGSVTPALKRKVKVRKRKKGVHAKTRYPVKSANSLKLNIPKIAYQKKATILPTTKRYSTQNFVGHRGSFNTNFAFDSETMTAATLAVQNIGESSSETDAKRSSKRKRVPKRFYGDSSDEESHRQQMLKWRRVDESAIPSRSSFPSTSKSLSGGRQQLLLLQQNQQQISTYERQQEEGDDADDDDDDGEDEVEAEDRGLIIAASDSESNAAAGSDSSNSEDEAISRSAPLSQPPGVSSSNLYCYCQCPYDEVSEMIACDGVDCQIEWFHFECVGITVPPKGKWYCPDCRRRLGIPDDEPGEPASG